MIEVPMPPPTNKYNELFKHYTEARDEMSSVLHTVIAHAKECESVLRDCRVLLANNPEAQEVVARIDELLTDPYQK